jgi:uncharacterized protein (TIGR02588 family)
MARPRPAATSKWEWLCAAIGAALLVACIAYLAWFGLRNNDDSPAVAIETIDTARRGDFHVVRLKIRNDSSYAAAALMVVGELVREGAVVERSELTLDYLPPFSTVGAGLMFRTDVAGLELRVRPVGYQEP